MLRVILTIHFRKQLKPFLKKYRNLAKDIERELCRFDKRQAVALGSYTYKMRLKSRDLPRGKSKSFRLIIFLIEHKSIIAPIAIYFKGEREDIGEDLIKYHLSITIKELEKDLNFNN